MNLSVVTTSKEGLSTTLVGEQVVGALKDLGHDPKVLHVDGRAGTPIVTKDLARRDVICLVEHKVVQIMKQLRFARPKSLVSVWTGNVEGYDRPDLMAYMSTFFENVYKSVPVVHVSHSFHTDTMFRELARETLSPSVASRFLRNTRTHLYGIDPAFKPGENDPDLLIAPMNRVVQEAKDVKRHHDLTTKFSAMQAMAGRKVTTKFYYAPGFGPESKSFDLSGYEFEPQPTDRAEYVRNASKAGMFLSVSKYESFGIYYLELLCSGAVGVFLDRPWVRELIPNYRYIVPAGELLSCMAHVRENYDEASSYVCDFIPTIRKRFDLHAFANDLINEIQILSKE